MAEYHVGLEAYKMQWSDPAYACSKCGSSMRKNNNIVMLSNPAQYLYKCDNCGKIDYQFV